MTRDGNRIIGNDSIHRAKHAELAAPKIRHQMNVIKIKSQALKTDHETLQKQELLM